MQLVNGTIESISNLDPNNLGYKKKELVLQSLDSQTCKIEFRGQMVESLDDFGIGDGVTIAFQMKCSTSKSSGITFNNLIAKSIKRNKL